MTGSDLIIKILIDEGITRCFGYPGGAVMPIYDSLYKMKSKIKHVRTAREDGAAHAADGYARSSGNVAALIATSGPGATNIITGIATAYADSVPMVVITANVSNDEIGTDSFQEADITGMTLSVTKYNWIVKDPEKLAEIMYKAIFLAKTGRPGPVLVDVPKDVLEHEFSQRYDFKKFSRLFGVEPELRVKEENAFDGNLIEEAAELINKSKRPVILCGGGIASADKNKVRDLLDFARTLNAPVTHTLMASGIIAKDELLDFGMIGKYGSEIALRVMAEADLIIAVAMRFSNRTHKFDITDKKIIHIERDAAELNKNVHANIPLNGDFDEVLSLLKPLINKRNKMWASEILSGSCEKSYIEECFYKIADALSDKQIVVSDVGMHQMAVANGYPFKGNKRFITSGGFGTMGFGLGAAIGAKLGNEDSDIVLFTGDGSFKMSAAELLTLRENNVKILVVIMNNASLEMVRKMQEVSYKKHYIATSSRKDVPNMAKLARSYGLRGITVNNLEDLDASLEIFKKSKRSVVIDLRMV